MAVHLNNTMKLDERYQVLVSYITDLCELISQIKSTQKIVSIPYHIE